MSFCESDNGIGRGCFSQIGSMATARCGNQKLRTASLLAGSYTLVQIEYTIIVGTSCMLYDYGRKVS